jgi:hypothetical protein
MCNSYSTITLSRWSSCSFLLCSSAALSRASWAPDLDLPIYVRIVSKHLIINTFYCFDLIYDPTAKRVALYNSQMSSSSTTFIKSSSNLVTYASGYCNLSCLSDKRILEELLDLTEQWLITSPMERYCMSVFTPMVDRRMITWLGEPDILRKEDQ